MTCEVILPPDKRLSDPDRVSVFLAGSIEMGSAPPWQDELIEKVNKSRNAASRASFFNPRRTDQDSSQKQSIEDTRFLEQVSWELDNLEKSDAVFFFFSGETKSPITLMELGYVLGLQKYIKRKIIVCCESDFQKRGNTEVMCNRHRIHLYDKIEYAIGDLKQFLTDGY